MQDSTTPSSPEQWVEDMRECVQAVHCFRKELGFPSRRYPSDYSEMVNDSAVSCDEALLVQLSLEEWSGLKLANMVLQAPNRSAVGGVVEPLELHKKLKKYLGTPGSDPKVLEGFPVDLETELELLKTINEHLSGIMSGVKNTIPSPSSPPIGVESSLTEDEGTSGDQGKGTQGAMEGVEEPTHSDDFTSVNWFGTRYYFTKGNQAETVKVLWEAWESGGHSLSQETIRARIESNDDRFRLSHVFRMKKKDGGYEQHPAWGSMIQEVTKGSYHLVSPDSSRITK